MILLKEWELSLLRRIEESNMTNYDIKEIDGEYYIKQEDLFNLIDETQDNRDYAEQKVFELDRALNSESTDELIDKSIRAEGSLLSVKKKIKELEEQIENLKYENDVLKNKALSQCNEDALDRLIEEGIELWEN